MMGLMSRVMCSVDTGEMCCEQSEGAEMQEEAVIGVVTLETQNRCLWPVVSVEQWRWLTKAIHMFACILHLCHNVMGQSN